MSSLEEPLVDILLRSSSATHHLATNFPITTLKRISERFANDFHIAKPDVIKVLTETRLQWTIQDPSGFLSIKGFLLLFTWLCNVLPSRTALPNTLQTDSTDERWGLLGVVAVRQACQYVQLAGEVGDQRSASVWLFKFLKARWTFEWDQKVLGWEEAVPGGWDEVVCAWYYMGEWPDARFWRNRLLNMAIARVHHWPLERARTEHEKLMAAIRSYHGRADDFRRWYEELTEDPYRSRRLYNMDHQRLRYSLAELNDVPNPRSYTPVGWPQGLQVDTPVLSYRDDDGVPSQLEDQMLDNGEEEPGGLAIEEGPQQMPSEHEASRSVSQQTRTPDPAASLDLSDSPRPNHAEEPIEHGGISQIDTPMMGADAEDGEIEKIGEVFQGSARKRKRKEFTELFRRKRRERGGFYMPHDIYRP